MHARTATSRSASTSVAISAWLCAADSDIAQPRGSRGHRRRPDRRNEDAARSERVGHAHRFPRIADDERLDRRRRGEQLPRELCGVRAEGVDQRAKMLAPRGIVANAPQRLAQGLGEERRRGRRVDVRPRRLDQRFDHERMRGDERARRRPRPCRAFPCRRSAPTRGRSAQASRGRRPARRSRARRRRQATHRARPRARAARAAAQCRRPC